MRSSNRTSRGEKDMRSHFELTLPSVIIQRRIVMYAINAVLWRETKDPATLQTSQVLVSRDMSAADGGSTAPAAGGGAHRRTTYTQNRGVGPSARAAPEAPKSGLFYILSPEVHY